MLLPVTSKLKKSDVFATITDMEKEIEIRTATGASIYRKPEGEFFDTSKIYPEDEPAEVFGFDPVLLSDALKAFKGEVVVYYDKCKRKMGSYHWSKQRCRLSNRLIHG